MGVPVGLQEFIKAGFEDFVIPVYEDAPFTTIQNRAKVTRSLKAVAGIERIPVRGVSLLRNEFGPNGERVFEADNKDSRIRFVGNWSTSSTLNGSFAFVTAGTSGEYAEISFWGTGLNILEINGSSRGFLASIDGGPEGATILPDTSTALNERNYNPNVVYPVTSGLVLGWHTVKIRRSTSGWSSAIYGFEILNERSDLAVYSGSALKEGSLVGLKSMITSAFDQEVSGSRGARVIKYIEGGSIKTAVTEVDSVPRYLTDTDHSNEEVIRRINFLEFGANRADDFSTLTTGSNRAFTLDDGSTNLVGSGVSVSNFIEEGFSPDVASNFYTISFIGTGLDISVSASTYTSTYSLTVDGILQGNITWPFGSGIAGGVIKLCSGLPYGTHNVKITRLAGGNGLITSDFIIYGPKKPEVSGLVIADFNLLADYINPGNTNLAGIPQGVIRKMNSREFVYSGTFTASSVNTISASGFSFTTTTAASYVEYRFWGTGFSYRFGNNAGAQSYTVSVNGSTNLSGFTTQLSATAGLSFTAATGVITGSPAGSIGENNLSVTGLGLGFHTVRVTWTSGNILSPIAFDIVTPIHINESTLKVGSLSLRSLTKFSPEKSISNAGPDLSKVKAWVEYDTSTSSIISSFNVSSVLQISSQTNIIVYFQKPFKHDPVVVGSGSNTVMVIRGVDNYTSGQTSKRSGVAVITASATNRFILAAFGELIDE